MQQVEFILGWNHTPDIFWWRVSRVGKQKSSACSLIFHVLTMGSSLNQVQLSIWLDSQALRGILALSTQKINFLTCLWSFPLRTATLCINVGTVDGGDNFHFTSWDRWSSAALPKTELTTLLTSAPELQTFTRMLNSADEWPRWACYGCLCAEVTHVTVCRT